MKPSLAKCSESRLKYASRPEQETRRRRTRRTNAARSTVSDRLCSLLECYKCSADVVGQEPAALGQPHVSRTRSSNPASVNRCDDGRVALDEIDAVSLFEVAEADPLRVRRASMIASPGARRPQAARLAGNRSAAERGLDVGVELARVHGAHAAAVRGRADAEPHVLAVAPVVVVVRAAMPRAARSC